MKYRAVFFDLDGTLMDTSDGIFAGGRYAMDTVGIPVPEIEDWNAFIGPPLGDCFRLTFGITDEDVIHRLCKAYHEFYMREGRLRAHFYPGILDVVHELKNRGHILGIASMKNEDLVQQMCRDFGVSDLFDVQLGIDLVGTMTKADLLRDGFAGLGLQARDCVLIGDTPIDAKGAADAGCDCIRVSWGFGFKKKEAGTISDPFDILKLV